MTGPPTPLFIESLGASYSQIAAVLTSSSIALVLSSYYWGRYLDKTRRRKSLITGSLGLLAVSYLMMALADRLSLVWIARVLVGIATAAYSTSSLALMGDIIQSQTGRGRRMGNYRGFGSLAFGIAVMSTGSIADRFSLRVPFGLSAIFLGVAFILSLALKEVPSDPAKAVIPEEKIVEIPEGREQSLAPLLVGTLAWATIMSAVYSMWPSYMASLGYSKTWIFRFWAIGSLLEFPLMGWTGHLSDIWGRRPMLGFCLVGVSVVFLLYIFFPIATLIVFAQILRAFAYATFLSASMTYVADMSAKRRGQVAGLYNAANGVGQIVGSGLGGTLTDQLGFVIMMGICSLAGSFSSIFINFGSKISRSGE
jgi:DHA1 family multidrug resistance protein-like MFS transporter